jgi:cell wall-associated NlpC family hydrolase
MMKRTFFLRIGVVFAVLSLGGTLLSPVQATPIQPPMSRLADVERQVSALEEQAALAAENWNEARLDLANVSSRIAALQRKASSQRKAYKSLSADLAGIIRTLYKSGAIDLDIQAMIATDPASFLAQLDAISIVGVRQEASLRRILASRINLKQSEAKLRAERQKAKTLASRANTERKTVERKLAQAQRLLDSLQASDRRARAARLAAERRAQAAKAKKESQKVSVQVSSSRMRRVLSYALAQVGDRYRMGGVGPSSYDCSGLTLMAYRQAGVSLSHFSLAQWSQTRRISRSQLRPGDLIFWFKGIRHVGMYIGNNKFVHAANYGDGVKISSLSERYYVQRLSGLGGFIG